MSAVKRWRATDHLERAAETAGGPEAFDAAVGEMLDEARGWRLAELRKRPNQRPPPTPQSAASAGPAGEADEQAALADTAGRWRQVASDGVSPRRTEHLADWLSARRFPATGTAPIGVAR